MFLSNLTWCGRDFSNVGNMSPKVGRGSVCCKGEESEHLEEKSGDTAIIVTGRPSMSRRREWSIVSLKIK